MNFKKDKTYKYKLNNLVVEYKKITDVPKDKTQVHYILSKIIIDKNEYAVSQLGMFGCDLLLQLIKNPKLGNTHKTYSTLANDLGYDCIIKGIRQLRDLGADIASEEIYRRLVIDEARIKYEGLYRKGDR